MRLTSFFLLLMLAPRVASATEVTFAGSIALDHRETFNGQGRQSSPGTIGIESTTLELAQKIVVDVTREVSFTAKACVGCHGVEVDQAFAEVHFNDLLNFRVGRINVPFGEFNTRHDPANYTTPSKPLPYAMGDMLHYSVNEFNLGIVPTPYSDNGLELFGGFSPGFGLQVDYTLYAVKGLVGQNDFDFVQSRSFLDNNRTPALGARLVASTGETSIGGSFCAGYYDPKDRLPYLMGGVEFYTRFRPVVLRGELLLRRTNYDPDAPGYLFAQADPYFIKMGWYGQVDVALTSWLTLIDRVDGLERTGMPLPGSDISQPSAGIFRNTVAAMFSFNNGFLVKAGYETWLYHGVSFGTEHTFRAALVFGY
jgi:hypothetical protein